ncbi:UNVERIFIED_CONTAM: hypothetical protein ITH36_25080, partial [Salmonella enterica subsp. enterica serovar Weltevreden]
LDLFQMFEDISVYFDVIRSQKEALEVELAIMRTAKLLQQTVLIAQSDTSGLGSNSNFTFKALTPDIFLPMNERVWKLYKAYGGVFIPEVGVTDYS